MYFMMCLLIGLGISFNITAIWIRHWHHDAAPKFKRKTESPVYLKSISISDMLFLIFQPLMIWQNEKIVWIRFSCYTLTGTISYKNCCCYTNCYKPLMWVYTSAMKIFLEPTLPLSNNLLNMNCGGGNFK